MKQSSTFVLPKMGVVHGRKHLSGVAMKMVGEYRRIGKKLFVFIDEPVLWGLFTNAKLPKRIYRKSKLKLRNRSIVGFFGSPEI